MDKSLDLRSPNQYRWRHCNILCLWEQKITRSLMEIPQNKYNYFKKFLLFLLSCSVYINDEEEFLRNRVCIKCKNFWLVFTSQPEFRIVSIRKLFVLFVYLQKRIMWNMDATAHILIDFHPFLVGKRISAGPFLCQSVLLTPHDCWEKLKRIGSISIPFAYYGIYHLS